MSIGGWGIRRVSSIFFPYYMQLGLNADLDFFEDVYMETLAEKLGMEVS